MSEEKKPTAPAAGSGAAPIACTTIRLPADDKKESRTQPAARHPFDPEKTVIPPEYPPPAG
ncbi:MAG: hypothetical protein ACREUX_15870 [Burkholderiales bacterium]